MKYKCYKCDRILDETKVIKSYVWNAEREVSLCNDCFEEEQIIDKERQIRLNDLHEKFKNEDSHDGQLFNSLIVVGVLAFFIMIIIKDLAIAMFISSAMLMAWFLIYMLFIRPLFR